MSKSKNNEIKKHSESLLHSTNECNGESKFGNPIDVRNPDTERQVAINHSTRLATELCCKLLSRLENLKNARAQLVKSNIAPGSIPTIILQACHVPQSCSSAQFF